MTMTDWDEVRIEELGDIIAGGTPSRGNPSYWNGSIPWVTPSEITELRDKYLRETRERITAEGLAGSAAKLLPRGSVLVTTRATLGEAAIAADPVATNQGFKSIIPNTDSHTLFTYYLIRSLKSEMERLASGTTFLEISKADFSRIKVGRPKYDEQTRIAAVLDTVDETIAKTEAVIAKLKQTRAGLLHDLLTRGLDEHGQLRDPIAHPEQFQDSPLGRIPKEWRVLTLNDVRATDTPITYGVLKPGPFVPEGTPLLQIEDVIHGRLELTHLHRIGTALDAEYSRTRVYGEEIVISLVGTIGQVAQLPSHIGHANLHRNLGLLRIGFGHAPRFFLHLLRAEFIQRQIRDSTFGSTQSLLNLGNLRALQIPVPQLAEQQRIQDVADSLDQQIDREVAVLMKFRLLKQGLMADLLTGRVRVPKSMSSLEN